MRTVLAYDIVDDRRRGRFFRRLKRLLLPMQKSVFEGDLSPPQQAAIDRLIHRELNLQEDPCACTPCVRPARASCGATG